MRFLLGAVVWAAFLGAPGLPLPGVDRIGFTGAAAAQDTIDIDTFYDELAPYGQWVWHPRYGYVWLPDDVSPRWRPYTVGRWVSTEEYGWYWDSQEPFAWAVYHYGRWGYDEDYGWFWVPGDTWAPAWVQWRYSDDYVGWAPIGPGRPGYAYGVPVNYDPPIAESWVFVQPRYMTSRAISHYALPIGGLGVAFFGATNVYRPIYRGGRIYNYGMPRDRVVKIIKRPIYVQKIYKVDNWKGGKFDRNDRNKGIKVYAPHFNKDGRPNRGPKKFVDNPKDFKPKAKLHDTVKGDVPKGWGKSAKGLTPIAKQDPDAFKRKHGKFGGQDDNDKNKGQANTNKFQDIDKDNGQANKNGDDDKGKNKGQTSKDFDRDGKHDRKGKNGTPPPPSAPPPVVKGATGDATTGKKDNTNNSFDARTQTEKGTLRQPDNKDTKNKNKNTNQNFGNQGGSSQGQQGSHDDNNQNKNKNKNQNFGDQGGSKQFKQGKQDNGGGSGNQRKQKTFGDQGGGGGGQGGQRAQDGGGGGGGGDKKKGKCQKNPDHPSCKN